MKKPIRHAITFLLMLSFSISGLMYVFFGIAQVDLKVQASAQIAAGDNLQTIKLSIKDFKNINGDELWCNGSLYDISSYVIVNDTVFVSVLHDGHEEQLVKSIVQTFESGDYYPGDTNAHIARHHTHVVNGGKILVAAYVQHFHSGTDIYFPQYFAASRSTDVYTAIPKPPPRHAMQITC